MNMRHRFFFSAFTACITALAAGCSQSDQHLQDAGSVDGGDGGGGGPDGGGGQDGGLQSSDAQLSVRVTNDSHAPFATTTGDFAWLTDALGIGVTAQGLVALDLVGANAGKPAAGFPPWTLSSSAAAGGQSASAIAIVPHWSTALEPYAFFLPNGRPQLGALRIGTPAMPGSVVNEHALDEPLTSMFPSALVVPSEGPTAGGLWIVDAVFGPGSLVRFYPAANWSETAHKITEDRGHRFTLPDGTTPNRLVFANDGKVALLSYSFLAPAPADAAGGVFAFDAMTGTQLGKLVLPISSTIAGALAFVGSVAATKDEVMVVSAVKSAMFADLAGQVAIYKVSTWSPFAVEDTDPQKPHDQPSALITTTLPNAVGLAIAQGSALVVSAPLNGDGVLDVVDLAAMPPKISASYPLGKPYSMGFAIPGDPKISPNGSAAMIATEIGLIRVELTSR
jgi:hypothetical protein